MPWRNSKPSSQSSAADPASEAVLDYQEALAFLDGHIGLGVRPGLERMRAFLDLLANPQLAYPIIHITGSNGKTSTARMVASILSAHGLNVGTFTSPHLERVEERLGVDGKHAGAEEFAAAIADIAPFADLLEAESGERPTYFELTAAAAFQWFAERAVDVAVIEVGLGGRLDATNVADGAVAVVTGISKEHVSYLGDTHAEIAREKLAIAKPGSVLITGPLPEEAEKEAARHAETLGIPRRAFGEDFRLGATSMAVGGWLVDIDGVYETYPDLYLPLHGRFQTRNLAVAVAAVEELFGRAVGEEPLREGVANATSPGRLEVIDRQPLIIVDGSHNDEGMEVLASALKEEFPPLEWTVVFGVLGDKDLPSMLRRLDGTIAAVVATEADSERAVPAAQIADVARRELGDGVTIEAVPRVADAVRRGVELAGEEGGVLATGSLYVAGEARPVAKLLAQER